MRIIYRGFGMQKSMKYLRENHLGRRSKIGGEILEFGVVKWLMHVLE
jgi:hypothetical protein